MEALVARSSVLSPPAVAGDASPSPSRPRVSAALPGPRRSPSTLAISTRWTRAPLRRGGDRLRAGSGEGGSPDPAGGAGGKEEYSPLLENNVTLRESHDMDTTKHDEVGISGHGGSNTGGSRTGLFRTPISGGVHSATAVHDLPPPALAVRNLMEQFAQLCTVMSRMHHRRAGYPFGSLVDFAPDPLGHPIFSLSPLAIHTRNLLADPRCSLVVQITGSSGLSNTRVTIFGDVIPLPAEQQEWAHQQYVSKHQQWASQQWGNFYYYRMETISDIYFIGGFGTVAWIDVKEYESLQPDKLSMDGGEQNLKEINPMFSKPLKELLSTEGEVDDVAVISMDSKGIDIRVRQGAQYGCGANGCEKLFHVPEYVHKHLRLKHPDLVSTLASRVENDIYFQNYMDDPDAPGGEPVMPLGLSIFLFIQQDRMRRRPDEQMCGASGGRGSDTLLLPKPSLVLIPVPGAGPYGPFVPVPPEMAMQKMQKGLPGPDAARHRKPSVLGPMLPMYPSFPLGSRNYRSYKDLDAPKEEIAALDLRRL